MKDWLKVAGCTALISLLGADIGLQVTRQFAAPFGDHFAATQQSIQTKGGNNAKGAPDYDYTPLIVGVLTLIVLAFQTLIFHRQGTVMKGQLRAAEDAASAAKIQARTAEQTISQIERPHLFPICEHNFVEALEPLNRHRVLYDHPTSGFPLGMKVVPQVTFRFRNYGRSPAIIRLIAGSIVAGPSDPAPVAPKWLDLPKENVLLPEDISADCVATPLDTFGFHVSSNDLTELLAGNTYWWFYGHVVYEDILDTSHTHFFCWRFDYSVRAFEPVPWERNYTEHKAITKPPPKVIPPVGAMRVGRQIPPHDTRSAP